MDPPKITETEKINSKDTEDCAMIDDYLLATFPASDPPAYSSMTVGSPKRPQKEMTMVLPKIKAAKRKPKKAKPAEKHSEVGTSSRQSFPASDPPSYSGGAIGAPSRNKSAKKKAPAKKAPGKKRPPIKEPAKKKKPAKRKAARPTSKAKTKAKKKAKA